VTDRAVSRHPLAEAVEAAVAAGVDWVQVRERTLGGAALLAHVEALQAAAGRGAARRGGGVRVLVNRRLDVALAAGADGVHLGGDALPPATARALLGAAALLGVSTHAPAELAAAAREPVDYAQLAPIFAPRSKSAARPALGLGALREAAGQPVAVLAQGGIDAARAAACVEAGAAGVCVTGEILLAGDPGAAAAALRTALDAAAARARAATLP
jgi:thiamine-phosphate pyrophosphorylase